MAEFDWQQAAAPFREAWSSLQGAATSVSTAAERGFWSSLEQLSTLPPAATQQAFASVRDWQVNLVDQAAQEASGVQRQVADFGQSLIAQAHTAGPAAAARTAVRAVEQGAVKTAKATVRGVEQVVSGGVGAAGQVLSSAIDAADAGFQALGQAGREALSTAQHAIAGSGVAGPVSVAARGAWGVLDDIEALVSELWQPVVEGAPGKSKSEPVLKSAASGAQGARGEQQLRAVEARPAPRQPESSQPEGNRDNSIFGLLGELVAQVWQGQDAATPEAASSGGAEQVQATPPSPSPSTSPSPSPGARQRSSAPLAPVLVPSFADQRSAPMPASQGGATGQSGRGDGRQLPASSSSDADDAELVERLNRALIEQAWLRGVDLT